MARFGFKGKKYDSDERVQCVRAALGARSLVMIGIMGCGKTSVGRRLSAVLNLPFVDADEEIEAAAGKTISEIFSDHGEAHFRDGERKVIARLLSHGPKVLATGGGAFMNAETQANIKKAGVSIWLRAELPLLMKRVQRRDNRPLLKIANPEAKMRELMAQRYPVYALADITVDSREAPHDAIVDDILDSLLAGPLASYAPAMTADGPDQPGQQDSSRT
jgi:shikimate kinase